MKQCPQCNNVFDDAYDYCLNDGTPLTLSTQPSYASQETPTVVAPRYELAPVRSSGRAKWIIPILLLSILLIGAIGVIGFLLFTRSSNEANLAANNSQNVSNKTPTPKPSPSTTPSKSPTLSPSPKADYPATTRLTFEKGAVTTKFSGDINPEDSRSFVLACATGQQLTANVTSDGNCVEFKTGGNAYDAITSKGDNIVAIRNLCSTKTTFRIDVSVE